MLNEPFDSFRASLDYADNALTAQQYEVFKLLHGRLDQQLVAWKQIMSSDVPAFNDAVKTNVPLLYVPPRE